MEHNQRIGRLGEELAAQYLSSLGWEIIARNWRDAKNGELDLIAAYLDKWHFIEVKTRSSWRYGHPLLAIEKAKLQRLHRLARSYLIQERNRTGYLLMEGGYQIDALAVTLTPGSAPNFELCLDVA
jgi:putative endonuclease